MYELCQTISQNHPALKDSGILTNCFEGGKYAVYHVYQEIFCRWLSKTGNQLDVRPILDIYRNVREDGYMEIDLCFPNFLCLKYSLMNLPVFSWSAKIKLFKFFGIVCW